MPVKIIDLSCPIRNESVDPSAEGGFITYHDHEEHKRLSAKKLGIPSEQVEWSCAYETVNLPSHTGTHVDAPWHFGPKQAGKPSMTIDQVPLEWLYGDGVMLDFSHKKNWDPITVEDLKRQLKRIKYTLKPGDIVLIRTGVDKYYYANDPKFAEMGTGLIWESVEWLIDQGIKVIATDSQTLDLPIPCMVQKYTRGDKSAFFPVHRIGRERKYLHIEKVFNMDKITQTVRF
jgi:kynurenine formamidase